MAMYPSEFVRVATGLQDVRVVFKGYLAPVQLKQSVFSAQSKACSQCRLDSTYAVPCLLSSLWTGQDLKVQEAGIKFRDLRVSSWLFAGDVVLMTS